MPRTNKTHSEAIAQSKDISVASKLGYLLLRRQYGGKESTPDQVVKAFSLAADITRDGFDTPYIDDKKLLPTTEFYANARAAIAALPNGAPNTALSQALDDLHRHCGVA